MIRQPFVDDLRTQIREKNDLLAEDRIKWIEANPYYYQQLLHSLRFIIEPKSKVLHVRCSVGYILNALTPSHGVGVDDSAAQIEIASRTYPHLTFLTRSPEDIGLNETFDYILVNSVEDIVDLKATFDELRRYATPRTRVIIIHYNFLWNPLVDLAEKMHLKIPQRLHNWISVFDLNHLLHLSRFRVIAHRGILLYPFYVPLLSAFFNRILARLPFFRLFTMIRLTIARPLLPPATQPCVSVIIPCRNEVGNIENAVKRIPNLAAKTEILFCDDHSTDGTADKVREMMQKYPEKDIKLLTGPGICKAENVWVGFAAAQGDILMILDGDLTVLPEELIYFYEAITQGLGEFINGSRLVYPMHKNAMRYFNVLGNKFFSVVFSYILDTRIKDTLCGTKVFWKQDYEKIKHYRNTWGIQDRWGDYELLFGAAKCHLEIVDLPVHYTERIYGDTKMTHRFQNGLIMLKMCLAALRKYKFY